MNGHQTWVKNNFYDLVCRAPLLQRVEQKSLLLIFLSTIICSADPGQ